MTAWRFRRCPQCKTVDAASKFSIMGSYRMGWSYGEPLDRQCPRCFHTAPTGAFQVVREKRAASWR